MQPTVAVYVHVGVCTFVYEVGVESLQKSGFTKYFYVEYEIFMNGDDFFCLLLEKNLKEKNFSL